MRGFYNGESYSLISNNDKRRDFLNDPKNWVALTSVPEYIHVSRFNHFGVDLVKVEIYGLFDKWDFESMDTITVGEWRCLHNGYYPVKEHGSEIHEPINATQAVDLLKRAYQDRGHAR